MATSPNITEVLDCCPVNGTGVAVGVESVDSGPPERHLGLADRAASAPASSSAQISAQASGSCAAS